MPKFEHLDLVEKETKKPDGRTAFYFKGHVVSNFVSLHGIPCVVVQNAATGEMHLSVETCFELVLNKKSTKEPPKLEDPNRPINPIR